MVFLLGVNFPDGQLVSKALTTFYGLSAKSKNFFPRAPSFTKSPSPARHNLLARIMAKHNIHRMATLGSLAPAQLTALTSTLSAQTIENDLKRKVRQDIMRQIEMGSYRGRRHIQHLPVRGQNTRSQIKTARKLNRLNPKE